MNLKRKTFLMMSAILLLSGSFLLAFTWTGPEANKEIIKTEAPENVPANAVGRVLPNGGYQIYYNKLVNEFQNGSDIQSFSIVQKQVGHCLVRMGSTSAGYRTETMSLQVATGGHLVYVPVWFTVCLKLGSNCTGTFACQSTYDNKGCQCGGVGNDCQFAGTGPEGVEVVVVM